MNRLRVLLIALCSLYSCYSSANALTDRVTLFYAYRAFSENVRLDKGQDTNSTVALALKRKLEPSVYFEYLPLSRMTAALQNSMREPDSLVCAIFKAKTAEREADYAFSYPLIFRATQRLFMQKSLPPMPKKLLTRNGGVVSLAAVMNHYKTSQLILTEGVSYGDFLDKEIGQVNERQVVLVSAHSTEELNARLFANKRADFSIFYPEEVRQISNIHQMPSYSTFTIGHQPAKLTSHIMCNKSNESRVFLRKVNAELVALYQTQEFLDAHFDFLPEDEHVIVEQLIEKEVNAILKVRVER
ncbi:hypothetical protein EYS14_18630 [Alteromonadaceae bacterium M269]|nr:hypothetical protein EYS14_18630 [Alteromonadaceae bacterium M269]